ncbi:hypothetical protein ACHHYP_07373 [Achlya hypogyna]|uniref:Uncharacterized protein n=1 Tax=Achlya hypogyna TaxID=1202772 RepID=A0A1V9ZLS9_ACHHY|nr:hypothetical protein ACHHYP_07373 [Achlya hypogyna]
MGAVGKRMMVQKGGQSDVMLPRVGLESGEGSTKILRNAGVKNRHASLPRLEGQKVAVSDRAMNKLGISEELVKMEKLMKKLGICDHDLEEFKQLQRHSALILENGSITKEEVVMGFSIKQMQRVKALKRLGATEQEIWDAYAYKISQLGSQLTVKGSPRKASSRT